MTAPPFNEIDSCGYLLVCDIKELAPQTLHLLVGEGRAAAESVSQTFGTTTITDLHTVRLTGRFFEISWVHYIAYCVRNETYCAAPGPGEVWVGERLRIYSKSRFLEYVSVATFASSEYPGPFQHYCVVSENHLIDVVSVDAPQIREKHR